MLNPIPESAAGEDQAGGQQRRDSRVATVMLVARLIGSRGDQLCRIRNISSNGLKVNTASPLLVGEEIRIELRNGHSVHGLIAWSTPPFAGMRFHRTEDVEELLSPIPEGDEAKVARLPRVQVNQAVLVHFGNKMLGASIVDLSQGGAKLRLRAALEQGDQVSLSVTGLGSLKATVRWTGTDEAGIAFHETIPFDALSHWLIERQGL